jgi:exodeoxyribonuclease VII large subunit
MKEIIGPGARNVLTVSELTREVKRLLDDNLKDIWVKGEVSNCRRAASGHVYFTLKDDKSVVKGVLFRGYQEALRFTLEDGLNVVVHGNVSLYEKRGEYQIIVDVVEPEGLGALQLAFEQLKEKLREEGLFEESRKKPIPPYPERIGVITSRTGAAIRDILHVIGRRYSGVRVILYPTLVQGDGAAAQIVDALRTANRRREVDVIILGRGGGSVEDLWPFNEEIVARAVAESDIPVISAVGHEIDFTISDFVADLRAPTPSAAAELVVRNKAELVERRRELHDRMRGAVERILSLKRDLVARTDFEVLRARMSSLLRDRAIALDDSSRMLTVGMERRTSRARADFEGLVGRLDVLSPLNTLARGYSITERLADNRPIVSVKDVEEGDSIKSRLRDGMLFSTVQTAIDVKIDQRG